MNAQAAPPSEASYMLSSLRDPVYSVSRADSSTDSSIKDHISVSTCREDDKGSRH